MDDSISRRSIAKIAALLAVAGSVLLGWSLNPSEDDRGDENRSEAEEATTEAESNGLPDPRTAGGNETVTAAIADRRSRREYAAESLSAEELGQLLWAAQGITKRRLHAVDFRAAPSAGATYPLEVFVVIGDPGVVEFDPGIYSYDPDAHALELTKQGDVQSELQEIAVDQEWVGAAALDIVITGVDERTTQKYGSRGRARYVPMEAGHAGENVYLQAESLGLSTVSVGAFDDDALRDLLGVSDSYRPLSIFPVGRRA